MSKIPVLDASIGDVAVFFRLNKDQAYIDSLALAHQGAARHVTISTAAFGERENRIYLKTAAPWTGGKSYVIGNPLEVEPFTCGRYHCAFEVGRVRGVAAGAVEQESVADLEPWNSAATTHDRGRVLEASAASVNMVTGAGSDSVFFPRVGYDVHADLPETLGVARRRIICHGVRAGEVFTNGRKRLGLLPPGLRPKQLAPSPRCQALEYIG